VSVEPGKQEDFPGAGEILCVGRIGSWGDSSAFFLLIAKLSRRDEASLPSSDVANKTANRRGCLQFDGLKGENRA
jgi:hypothetical protein